MMLPQKQQLFYFKHKVELLVSWKTQEGIMRLEIVAVHETKTDDSKTV